jgi:hypothetical protein
MLFTRRKMPPPFSESLKTTKKQSWLIAFASVVSMVLLTSLIFSRNSFACERDGIESDMPGNMDATTHTIIDHQRPNQTSEHATVMGMATNYHVGEFRNFVGSLRKSGFLGNIILAISPDPKPGVVEYLTRNNVTMKRLTMVDCKTDIMGVDASKKADLNEHDIEVMTCADPYPDLKVRWGRFALLRDYLFLCKECTGPVLVADVRDTVFQRDPFGPEAPPVTGLQVFEEHRTIRTTHWIVKFPIEKCKDISFNQPMLCSGTTIGTRIAMLRYLSDMVNEMKIWMQDPKCCCNKMSGDDQAIHNYLYYSGKLPYANAIKNRMGLVNTVGGQGSLIFEANRERIVELAKVPKEETSHMALTSKVNEAKGVWLGLEYDLTDEQGFFINYDGERSFVIHQYDRFGPRLSIWLDKSGLRDHE